LADLAGAAADFTGAVAEGAEDAPHGGVTAVDALDAGTGAAAGTAAGTWVGGTPVGTGAEGVCAQPATVITPKNLPHLRTFTPDRPAAPLSTNHCSN